MNIYVFYKNKLIKRYKSINNIYSNLKTIDCNYSHIIITTNNYNKTIKDIYNKYKENNCVISNEYILLNKHLVLKTIQWKTKEFNYFVDNCKRNFSYINNIKEIKPIDDNWNLLEDNIYKECNIKKEYIFIIPYMYNGDRWPIFQKCIDNLYNIKQLEYKICIHEIGNKSHLNNEFIKKYKIDYMFSEWNEIFHRSWVLNKAARQYSKYDNMFILMDGDLIVTEDWINNLEKCKLPKIGWNKLYYLSKYNTKQYLKNDNILEDYNKVIKPNLCGAAGGISIISSEIYYELKGFPENFRGTWGGEDNAFWAKFINYGKYSFKCYNQSIYHLYHEHTTLKNNNIRNKWTDIKKWDYNKWKNELNKIGDNWGNENPLTYN
jgi:hypothetical protein